MIVRICLSEPVLSEHCLPLLASSSLDANGERRWFVSPPRRSSHLISHHVHGDGGLTPTTTPRRLQTSSCPQCALLVRSFQSDSCHDTTVRATTSAGSHGPESWTPNVHAVTRRCPRTSLLASWPSWLLASTEKSTRSRQATSVTIMGGLSSNPACSTLSPLEAVMIRDLSFVFWRCERQW